MTQLNPKFGARLLATFEDPQKNGVHLLLNDWWKQASQEAIDSYTRQFEALPGATAFIEEGHFAKKLTIKKLATFAPHTLGNEYYRFLTENKLEANLATNYRLLHMGMQIMGKLKRMPKSLRYAVIRGFQQHDILHVLTGYKPDSYGELALQAFCLAQMKFPYFAMWMSVSTTRMSLLEPDLIDDTMNAISEGWSYGRRAGNIQFETWDQRLGEPLDALRSEFGLDSANEAYALAA